MIFGVCRLQLLCLRSAYRHFDIAYYFSTFRGEMYRTHTFTFAYIFESWARKKHNFWLHWQFSLLSPQQKCAGYKRNKTHRLSASFCTKNHQNPFSILRERVDWRCHASSKKVPKLKTRVLLCMNLSCMLGELTKLLKLMIRLYMSKTRVFGFGTFLELAWHLQSTRSRRLLNWFWWFLVQNKVESLLVLFLLFPAHVCWGESNENF